MNLNELTLFLKLLADQSADIIRRHFRSSLNVENKPDFYPVTIADKKAEECMRDLITKEFLEHGIMARNLGNTMPRQNMFGFLTPSMGQKVLLAVH